MQPHPVAVLSPFLDEHLGSRVSNTSPFSSLPPADSTHPFSHGLAFPMEAVLAPRPAIQAFTALAMNSGSRSERIDFDLPQPGDNPLRRAPCPCCARLPKQPPDHSYGVRSPSRGELN